MLETVSITNYKSIASLKLNLGLVNVFIGENGAGKSNILEALTLAGAAQSAKLNNEFLVSRGVRITAPKMMRSAFNQADVNKPIKISVATTEGSEFGYKLNNDNKPYSTWTNSLSLNPRGARSAIEGLVKALLSHADNLPSPEKENLIERLASQLTKAVEKHKAAGITAESHKELMEVELELGDNAQFRVGVEANTIDQFVIYSPENSALRMFEREGQIEPLGINGEGLLKLLSVMSKDSNSVPIQSVKNALKHFSWFEDFTIVDEEARSRMQIKDIFLDRLCNGFDQRSANEGFLFLTFYFALFSSNLTPKFFAIDNVDASLNPKLCQSMIEQLVNLAKANGKQAILTTHNPAVLDGLNLRDNDQRLFVVSRDRLGKTKVRRFDKDLPTGLGSRMSELFLRGAIGGLPKGF